MKTRAWLLGVMAFVATLAFAQPLFPPISLVPPTSMFDANVAIYGKVDNTMADQVVAAIHLRNRSPQGGPIILMINSPGGSVFAMLRIMDAMHASARQVNTVCVGMCASAAGVIFLHGTQRVMLPHAWLLLHDGQLGVEDTTDKVYSMVAVSKRIDDEIEKYIAKMTGFSKEKVHSLCAEDWWLDASEALAAHLSLDTENLTDFPAN